jgi:chromosome segregation ATPase
MALPALPSASVAQTALASEEGGTELAESEERGGIRARGEEAIGELAQALIENPVFNQALSRTLGAGERAMSAQRSALGALNVATSSDLERVEQRLRSLSARLESIEDSLDRLAGDVSGLRKQMASAGSEVSSDQSRLAVSED